MLTSLIFRCNVTSCAKPSSNPIPSLPAPSAGSGLALIAPGPGLRRQYFVNNDSFISEATLAPNTDWSTPQAISNKVKAHRASPVAATMVNSDIWVFWFNEAKILQVSSSVWKTGIWSVGKAMSPYLGILSTHAYRSAKYHSSYSSTAATCPWSRSIRETNSNYTTVLPRWHKNTTCQVREWAMDDSRKWFRHSRRQYIQWSAWRCRLERHTGPHVLSCRWWQVHQGSCIQWEQCLGDWKRVG